MTARATQVQAFEGEYLDVVQEKVNEWCARRAGLIPHVEIVSIRIHTVLVAPCEDETSPDLWHTATITYRAQVEERA